MRKFDHNAFVLGLGFVAGFVDVFGFSRLAGLLPAHVTGNLIFLALYLAHGKFEVLMFLAALPIFCGGVMVSAWAIGWLAERGRDPFLPALLAEAGLIFITMLLALLLPASTRANTVANLATGTAIVLAMAVQNTLMRLVLNNLPPTTVMTGNLTQVLSDVVAFAARFPSISHTKGEKVILERQAKRMLLTLLAFFVGALVSGLSELRIGMSGLILPVAALLALIPFHRRVVQG